MVSHPSAYRRTGSVAARRRAVSGPLSENPENSFSNLPATPEAQYWPFKAIHVSTFRVYSKYTIISISLSFPYGYACTRPVRKDSNVRTSKTAASERTVPLTDVAASAFARLSRRAEGFGSVEPSHYIFAAFVPKFTFSGKKVIGYNVTSFDPTRHVNSWRSARRTLTKKAGLSGFRFHDLRHCAITVLAENGASDLTIMAIAGHVSRRMLERYSHVRMEAKRKAMEDRATSTRTAGGDTTHDTNPPVVSTRPV
jgi:Phage integrase family